MKNFTVIDENILLQAGAEIKHYKKKEFIFLEGNHPYFFYQIKRGKIKLNNYTDEGVEFLQNILHKGETLGDDILFTKHAYPMNAVALTDCSVFVLPKNLFHLLLQERPELVVDICQCMAERLYFKFVLLQSNASRNPQNKLKGLMSYLKNYHKNEGKFTYQIPLTRQQMASLTGLAVETVIRAIKNLEQQGELIIKNRKIYI